MTAGRMRNEMIEGWWMLHWACHIPPPIPSGLKDLFPQLLRMLGGSQQPSAVSPLQELPRLSQPTTPKGMISSRSSLHPVIGPQGCNQASFWPQLKKTPKSLLSFRILCGMTSCCIWAAVCLLPLDNFIPSPSPQLLILRTFPKKLIV